MFQKLIRSARREILRRMPSHPIGEARRLLRSGRPRDAIALLAKVVEERSDPEVAQELVQLRHDAALQGNFAAPAQAWPPDVPDLFPGNDRIPEIRADEFSPEALASGILHHGGLIVRSFMQPEEVERCAACVRNAFASYTRFREGTASQADFLWYYPFQPRSGRRDLEQAREFAEVAAGVLGADSPATVHEVLKFAQAHGILAAVESFLGEPPAISVRKTTARIVPPTTGTSWHQDGRFLGDYVRSANMWIALSECGESAPSLDIVPKRLDHIVETGTEGAPLYWTVADSVAERTARNAGVEILHLDFAPGDVIFFDHMNLHRTGVRPGMTQERLAIEWWFFAPSRFPAEQIPILA